MALLAATTLGVEGANTVRAEVRGDADLAESREYRLVVQSYDAGASKATRSPSRPLGSLQRSITADELRRGIQVNLLELGQGSAAAGGDVVAWIEDGKPDLEFDGRTARPLPGSLYGQARRGASGQSVQIRLTRKAA